MELNSSSRMLDGGRTSVECGVLWGRILRCDWCFFLCGGSLLSLSKWSSAENVIEAIEMSITKLLVRTRLAPSPHVRKGKKKDH